MHRMMPEGCGGVAEPTGHAGRVLIEVSTFGLRDGVDREQFLAADHGFQEQLNSQPGFIRRTTAEGDTGWIVIALWSDEAAADGATALLAEHPFGALTAGADVRRYTDIGG